jgi:hypothetical protein
MAALRELDLEVTIQTTPTEVENAIPFEQDYEHASYDPTCAERFWRQLMPANRVLTAFRSRFIGKVSPVHFFWGSFDLAVTRFSGRTAPRHPGGAPIPSTPDQRLSTAAGGQPSGARRGRTRSRAAGTSAPAP